MRSAFAPYDCAKPRSARGGAGSAGEARRLGREAQRNIHWNISLGCDLLPAPGTEEC